MDGTADIIETPGDASPAKRPQNRSAEELAMRALIVPELRKRWPDARIIHELGVRYSTNRIDLAAVAPREIIACEIKSSVDVTDRLEAQLRAFAPIATLLIVALAPKWNEKLPGIERKKGNLTSYIPQYTEAQSIIRAVAGPTETWTVDAIAGTIDASDRCYRTNQLPWTARMLDMLHVAELQDIAARHRVSLGKRANHARCVSACFEVMTGGEIIAAVCRALRARDAYAEGSDPPITPARAPAPAADTESPLELELEFEGARV